MASIDQTGIPTVVAAESTTPGALIGAAVAVPETPSASYGSLVGALLDEYTGAAVIVVDPNSRAIWAATSTAGSALLSTVSGVAASSGTITPDAAQEGRSLTFTASIASLSATTQAAINATVATQKPARTVGSMIATVLSYTEFGDVLPVFVVDQTMGNVKVLEFAAAGDANAELANVTWVEGKNQTAIDISEPDEPQEAEPIIFEGGSTS